MLSNLISNVSLVRRANVNIKPTKWLKTGFNVAATRSSSTTANTQDNSAGYNNPFFFSRNIGPVYPIHEHDMTTGEYILDSNGNKVYDYRNPWSRCFFRKTYCC